MDRLPYFERFASVKTPETGNPGDAPGMPRGFANPTEKSPLYFFRRSPKLPNTSPHLTPAKEDQA
jgi:hypothetical protein